MATHCQVLLTVVALLALLAAAAALTEPAAPPSADTRRLHSVLPPVVGGQRGTALPDYDKLSAANMCGSRAGCPARLRQYGPNGNREWAGANLYVYVGWNMTGQCAITSEECILANVNGALKQIFDMPRIRALTGFSCRFNGLSTWEDLAALFAGFPEVNWDNFLSPAGVVALLQAAVDKQATWVESQSCAWQARPFREVFLPALSWRILPSVFDDLTTGSYPWRRQPFDTSHNFIVADQRSAFDLAISTWSVDYEPWYGERLKAAAANRPVLPQPAVPYHLVAGMLKKTMTGVPAITCDCRRLSQDWSAATQCGKPRVFNQGQAYLNSLLSGRAPNRPDGSRGGTITGLPFKLGSPLIFGCYA